MSKLKTHNAIAKRFKMTGKKKKNKHVMHRKGGQDHFNAKESGDKTREKRLDRYVDETIKNTIKKLMPYS